LDSSAIELVMSLKSIKKNKFKTRKLERLIYIRNVDGIFNYEGPICYELKSLGLDNRTTLVLSNIRELDRELFYKLVYFI